LREVHPEVCFWALAGGRAMEHSKKTAAERRERLAVLMRYKPEAGVLIECPISTLLWIHGADGEEELMTVAA
jgi:hypothetical protein